MLVAQTGERLLEAICKHIARPLLPDVVVVCLTLIIENIIFYIHPHQV